jgi:ribosomal protein S18 acetylase RimI-like enzyme
MEIRPLGPFQLADIQRVMTGYVTDEIYQVRYSDSERYTRFEIELARLEAPVRRGGSDHVDTETLHNYQQVAQEGFSFGAYDGETLVGVLIAELRRWNNSLWVWEFHVAQEYRGKGLGRGMMEQAAEAARAANLRTIICETQNHNVPAIRAYRRLGFVLESIDISYYTNEDYPDPSTGIAVFMKRRL